MQFYVDNGRYRRNNFVSHERVFEAILITFRSFLLSFTKDLIWTKTQSLVIVARVKLAADQTLLRRPWTMDGTDAFSWRVFALPIVVQFFPTEHGACQRTPIAKDLHENAKVERKSASFAVGIFLEFSWTGHLPGRERRVKEFVAFIRWLLGPWFLIECKYRWNKPHRDETQSRLEETGVRRELIELDSPQPDFVAPWNWPDAPHGQT
jgi:hypothetical protein